MKFRLTREQRIGLFTIITLSAVFILVNYLKGRDIFGKRNTYYAIYENVEGLTATGPVYIRGLKVGTVVKIDYQQNEDYFLVVLKVKDDYAISSNSVAEIYSSDLLGSKAIRINMGNNGLHLKNNDTLLTATEPGVMNMLTKELIPLKKQAEVLINTMNETFTNVNEVLDEKNRAEIASTLNNLNSTLNNLKKITENLESKTPEISSIISNLDSLSGSLNENSKSISAGIDNFNTITEDIKNSDLKETISSLHELLKKLQDPKGTAGKLLTTDSLHQRVNGVLMEMEKLIQNINSNPKKYIKVSVF